MAQATARDIGERTGGVHGKDGAKPVFFIQLPQPASSYRMEDVYRAVSRIIEAGDVQGIQRIGNLWRIYPHSTEDRVNLLASGISIRGKQISLQDTNPFAPKHEGTKVTIHGIPLSASDTIITTALRRLECDLTSDIERQLLRVDGRLTSCQTGARTVFIKQPTQPLPRFLKMGRYRGTDL